MMHSTPSPAKAFANPTRWWDPFSAIVLLAAVFVAVNRLIATKWTPELPIVAVIALCGAIVGLALGQSRYSRKMAVLMGLAYGLVVIIWQLGSLAKGLPDWADRMAYIVQRLSIIYLEIVTDQKLTDSLLFVVIMSLLFWAVSLQAGFSLTRRGNAWTSVLPIGLIMFVIHYYFNCPYSPDFNVCNDIGLGIGSVYLAIFLFFAILLIARLSYLQRMHTWQMTRSYVSPEVSYDLTRFTVVVAVVVIVAAWFVPTVKADPLPLARRLWDRAGLFSHWVNDALSPIFENIRSSVVVPVDDFGTSLSLGQGASLSDEIKLSIQVPGFDVSAPFYWRNRVFDRYENGQWESVFSDTVKSEAGNFQVTLPDFRSDFQVIFRVTPSLTLWHLYTPAGPVGASGAVSVEMNANPDGTADLFALKSEKAILAGETYQVRAVVNNLTIRELRQAGSDYPAWVSERYLQLPDSITARTRQLAQEITANLETPYDQVEAVTNYLRENIEYQGFVDTPPPNQEVLDWLLFDYRKGFCNYYASAEVILLRSLGIPARLVVGYAQGEQRTERDIAEIQRSGQTAGTRSTFIVRARDAHAWPEVFFPGIGWVEFEPTASRTPILRPSGDLDLSALSQDMTNYPRDLPQPDDEEENMPPDRGSDPLVKPSAPPAWLITLRWSLVAGLVGLLLALIVWRGPLLVKLEARVRSTGRKPPEWLTRWAEESRQTPPLIVRFDASLRRLGIHPPVFVQRWVNWVNLSPVARSYVEVNRALHRLGQPPKIEETPAERAHRLAALLPEAAASAQRLIAEYHAVTYSHDHHSADPLAARQAASEIRKLSLRAWFVNLPARLGLRLQNGRSIAFGR